MKKNWLDPEKAEVWSKAHLHLPVIRTTEMQSNNQGKMIFKHAPVRLVVSDEPLMGC